MLNLWRHLAEQQRSRSSSSFRRMCTAEFLHYLRVREWQDLVEPAAQRRRGPGPRLGAERPVRTRPSPPADAVHQALLAGLLSHIGMRDGEQPRLPRRARHAVRDLPGLGAGEETAALGDGRRAGRDLAAVGPGGRAHRARVGRAARRAPRHPHLQRAALGEAPRPGDGVRTRHALRAAASSPAARSATATIDPALSRELFIRRALVEGDWRTHHAFFAANQQLRDEVAELEHRVRRRDLLVDDETLFDFYDQRIGPDVVSGRPFRQLVEARPAARSGPADADAGGAAARAEGRRRRAGLSRTKSPAAIRAFSGSATPSSPAPSRTA